MTCLQHATSVRVAAMFVAVLVATATPTRADLTGFIGANTTPANRQVKGVAVGAGFLLIGFEFEYASTVEDVSALAPSLDTGMGNLLLQTPVPILGFQPYVTTGGGIYREELGSRRETSFGINTGGGVKVTLTGPIRLRVDYRVFKLGSGALRSPTHRAYVGLNLKF
jgi:opacity protein-like surface antigen